MCEYLSLETDLNPTAVDALIQKLLQEDKIHLPRIKRFLEQYMQLRPYLEQIATGIEIPYNPLVDTRQKELSLLGIIKSDENGLCIIRNRIYEKAFKNFLMASSLEYAHLISILSTRLSEEALVGLSMAYGVNFKALTGIDKEAKIQSLVQSLEERGLLTVLSQYIQSLQLEDQA
jgi:hypothetical protein